MALEATLATEGDTTQLAGCVVGARDSYLVSFCLWSEIYFLPLKMAPIEMILNQLCTIIG